MSKRGKRIGELLVEQDCCTREQIKEALEIQQERGGKLAQILINLGHLTEEGLLRALGNQQGVVSVQLQQYTIDPGIMQFVPKAFAVQHELMPLDKLGKNLTVAMAVPLDTATQEKLEDLTGLRIRAVLCSRSDVRAAIAHYYGVEDFEDTPGEEAGAAGGSAPSGATQTEAPAEVQPGPEAVRLKNILGILETVDQFPLLPDVHSRILRKIEEPDVSVEELTALMSQDPTLSANVLKLANSAAYAARTPFDSVHRAIAYIGLRELHGIVLGTAVLDTLTSQAGFDLSRMFMRSFHCGVLCKIVSDKAKTDNREVAFTAGLLHNIGTIVLRMFSEERLHQIEERVAETGRPRPEIEEELLGVTASEVGYQLADRWNIPDSLKQAIRFHDRLDSTPEPGTLAVTVALARRCIDNDDQALGFGSPSTDPYLQAYLEKLRLSGDTLASIEQRYRDNLDRLPRLDLSLN